ncbi:MAG: hypothetical protein ACRCXC_03935 [Legionella sp.]
MNKKNKGWLSLRYCCFRKNDYHPEVFSPFEVKGILLPVQEDTLFTNLKRATYCPLVKIRNNQELILFLIHPQSNAFYCNLLNDSKYEVISLSALSLSSFRTVLIAFPNAEGSF